MQHTPDALHTRDLETGSHESYRLAGSPPGTGGSSGSLLEEAAELVGVQPGVDLTDAGSLEEFTRRHRERTARALALEHAATEYHEAVRQTEIVRRSIERKQAARRRQSERAGVPARRRANRPVKVEVDPHGWAVVKREAIRHRRTVGAAVGELVCRSAHSGVRPRRSTAQSSAQPSARRFARLVVDDATWAQFRVLALDVRVSTGRCVRLLVELEARRIERSGR